MDATLPAPIACTLTPAEFAKRRAWIATLTSEALLAHRVADGVAHLLYRLAARDRVEELVRQEQACCGFLHYELSESSAGLALTITAPGEVRTDAALLFAHLIPASDQGNGTNRPCHCDARCGA